MSSKKSIVIFLSSTRPDRMAERVGNFVKGKVEANGMNVQMFDPVVMKFEVLKVPFHFMPKPEDAPAWLQDANEKIKTADGFIIVSGEYNSFIPPALTNMMDHFSPAAYRHRPVGLITYSIGGFGGIRAQTVLPIFTIELGMINIPTRVSISTVQNTFSEDGKCKDDKMETKINDLIKEIDWYSDAIVAQKLVSSLP